MSAVYSVEVPVSAQRASAPPHDPEARSARARQRVRQRHRLKITIPCRAKPPSPREHMRTTRSNAASACASVRQRPETRECAQMRCPAPPPAAAVIRSSPHITRQQMSRPRQRDTAFRLRPIHPAARRRPGHAEAYTSQARKSRRLQRRVMREGRPQNRVRGAECSA